MRATTTIRTRLRTNEKTEGGAEVARSQFTWTGIAQQLVAATEQRVAEDAATRVVLTEFDPVTCWSDPKASVS